MNANILETIKKIQDIPTLPTVAIEIISLAQSPDVQIGKLSEVIHQDPPLATKILKAANSSFYRRGDKEVETIQRALMILGLNEIVDLTSTISVFSAFPMMAEDNHSIRMAFWNHCLATGIIAKQLSGKLGVPCEGREFVGGLLHDIGKIIMDEYFHDIYTQAHQISHQQKCPMFEAERQLMGTDHMEVGAFLAKQWNLPSYLEDIILWHHNPGMSKNQDLAAIVSIANLLAKGAEMGCGGDQVPFVLEEQEGWQILQKHGYPLDDIDIARLTFELSDMQQEVANYINSFNEQTEQNHGSI